MVSEKFYVGYSEINKDFELSNVALLNMFQDVTTIHGKLVNDSLKSQDGGWFLTAYKVKIHKRPEYETYVKISSWSRGIKGFTASREFEIRDDAGNLQVSAISNWIRINKHTQKIERISEELANLYGMDEKTNFDSEWIAKLTECENVDFETKFIANRNYIDIHKHLNNVSYMKLAELVLPEAIYNKSEALEFEIMYRQAIKYNEEVRCLFTDMDEYYNITVKSLDLKELKAIIRLYKNK